MSGMVCALRPPKMIALMGTPVGSSHAESMVGHLGAGAVKRAFGWAAFTPVFFAISGVQTFPCQSSHSAGGFSVIPSHQIPPSGVSATLVKIEFFAKVAIALGFVFTDVPGATPKKPASGLMARSRPSASGVIQAISSPTVQTLHPLNSSGGTIIAKFVFPQALGKAAAT